MNFIRITADGNFPETITLDAGEILLLVVVILLLVVVILVLVDIVFLLVMKHKYTVRFKNRKLRDLIDELIRMRGG